MFYKSPVRLIVAVGVIQNEAGQILISKRADDVHQAGLWEFPGGKLETGETARDALKRELLEELGIYVIRAKPLLKISHQYDDLAVLLDVFMVTDFDGEACGMEQQAIKWVDRLALNDFSFPEANKRIIDNLLSIA